MFTWSKPTRSSRLAKLVPASWSDSVFATTMRMPEPAGPSKLMESLEVAGIPGSAAPEPLAAWPTSSFFQSAGSRKRMLNLGLEKIPASSVSAPDGAAAGAAAAGAAAGASAAGAGAGATSTGSVFPHAVVTLTKAAARRMCRMCVSPNWRFTRRVCFPIKPADDRRQRQRLSTRLRPLLPRCTSWSFATVYLAGLSSRVRKRPARVVGAPRRSSLRP